MDRLLLHACCANCLTYPYLYLVKKYNVSIFFYNPNIYPEQEYKKRLSDVKEFADIYGADLIIGTYESIFFNENIKGLEQDKEGQTRCRICFKIRLEETKNMASANGYDYFTTTLSVSPYKNADVVNDIGNNLSDNKVRYLKANFKKRDGFKIANSLSKSLNFYRQKYCGCEFSVKK